MYMKTIKLDSLAKRVGNQMMFICMFQLLLTFHFGGDGGGGGQGGMVLVVVVVLLVVMVVVMVVMVVVGVLVVMVVVVAVVVFHITLRKTYLFFSIRTLIVKSGYQTPAFK